MIFTTTRPHQILRTKLSPLRGCTITCAVWVIASHYWFTAEESRLCGCITKSTEVALQQCQNQVMLERRILGSYSSVFSILVKIESTVSWGNSIIDPLKNFGKVDSNAGTLYFNDIMNLIVSSIISSIFTLMENNRSLQKISPSIVDIAKIYWNTD